MGTIQNDFDDALTFRWMVLMSHDHHQCFPSIARDCGEQLDKVSIITKAWVKPLITTDGHALDTFV